MKKIDENTRYFTIGEFVSLCDTTRDTLYHYEKQGLLFPTVDDNNGYRYYCSQDYYIFMYISHLAKMGFSLNEAKEYLKEHSVNNYLKAMDASIARTSEQQQKLTIRAERTKRAYENLQSKNSVPFNKPQIIFKEEEYFFKTPLSSQDYKYGSVLALSEADKYANENHIDRIRHFLGFYSEEQFTEAYPTFSYILSKTSSPIEGELSFSRPAGMYISMCTKGFFKEKALVPHKIMNQYLEDHRFTPKPGVMVEIIVGPFFSSNPDEYIAEISVQIE